MVTYLVEADGEEDETTAGLDKQRLLLFGQIHVADKLAMHLVFRVGSSVSGRRGLFDGLCGVCELALGEETRFGKVVVVVGQLGSRLLGRSGVDVDASEASSDLLRGGLGVVLSDGRHDVGWMCLWMQRYNEGGTEGMQAKKAATMGSSEARCERRREKGYKEVMLWLEGRDNTRVQGAI